MATGDRIQTLLPCFKLNFSSFLNHCIFLTYPSRVVELEKQSNSVLLLQHLCVSFIGKIWDQTKLLDGIVSWIDKRLGS